MFTGIINRTGVVVETGPRLRVRTKGLGDDLEDGESISVNGVCLTVVEVSGEGTILDFDLSPETLARTSLGSLAPGGPVNLERSATLMTRLGGHLVQGHVDGVGHISGMRDAPPGREMRG